MNEKECFLRYEYLISLTNTNLHHEFEDLSDNLVSLIEKKNRQINELTKALSFTLLAAEHLYKPDEPLPEGLPAIYYHTLSYEGDLELNEKTKQARKLLNLYKGE